MQAIALYVLFSVSFYLSITVSTYNDRVHDFDKTIMKVVCFMGWFFAVSMMFYLLLFKILIFFADDISTMFKYIDLLKIVYDNWYFFLVGLTIQFLLYLKVLMNLKVTFWEFIFAK